MDDLNKEYTRPTTQASGEDPNKLPDLGPSSAKLSPSTAHSLPVSDPNLLQTLQQNQVIPTNPTTTSIPSADPTQFNTSAPPPVNSGIIKPTDDNTQIFSSFSPLNQTENTQPNQTTYPNPNNPLGVDQTGQNTFEPDTASGNKLHKLPISKPVLLGAVLLILVLGVGGFGVNEFVLNRLTNLKLVGEDAQFYLSLSVKNHDQAKKAKDLVGKFPGGKRILTQFDKYYTQYVGGPNDPLIDITQYAENELLLSRVSKADTKFDSSNRLFTIVDTKNPEKSKEAIADFIDDTGTYKTVSTTYKGGKIIDIKLKSEQELEERDIRISDELPSLGIPTPKPKTLFASNIEKYLVASDKEDDVKKAITLSQTRKILGFSKGGDPKSILDSKDHQSLASNFQKDSFIKYFQRDPITPYNLAVPFFYTIGISTYPNSSETEARTFQKVTRGIDVSIAGDGAKVNTYSLDLPQMDSNLYDFKINDSLASKLPKKYSDISPTFYFETRNLKGQWQDQQKLAEEMKNSKNRKQREEFENYIKNQETLDKSYKDSYNVDYQSDILSWMDEQVGMIFNAGSAKKAPEFILVASINDKGKVEDSLKKFRIPNYQAESNDRIRQSDLRSIVTALATYKIDNRIFPNSLNELVTKNRPNRSFSYLFELPKDPKTLADYPYQIGAGNLNYTISSQLENGQTLTYSTNSGISDGGKFTGTKQDIKFKPTSTSYKGNNLYQTTIFEYQNIKYYLYFIAVDNKAVIAFSDSDNSVKEIADFNGGDTLTKTEVWKKQFEKVGDKVGAVSLIEPINLWGIMEYLKANYPEYKNYAGSYGANGTYLEDLEKAVKGYLRTIPSIGTYLVKKGDVQISKTWVNVVELSSNDKQEAEDAMDRLLKTDDSNRYESVLGVDSKTFSDKAREDWNKFYHQTLKQVIDPQAILAN